MRSICLILLLIGVSQAAQSQFRAAPVYSPAKPIPAPAPLKSEAPVAIAPQMAQAREGTATPSESTSAAQTPAQNFMVYYYPQAQDAYRTGAAAPTAAVGTYATNEPGMLHNIPWKDVGYVVSALVLFGAGGYLTYNGFGGQVKEVKARALRELQDLSYDDATHMARRVLRAIEKFQNLNTEAQ